MINMLTKSDVASRGVAVLDLHLAQMAQRADKTISAIENVEDQCQPLNNLRLEWVWLSKAIRDF